MTVERAIALLSTKPPDAILCEVDPDTGIFVELHEGAVDYYEKKKYVPQESRVLRVDAEGPIVVIS